MNPIRMSPSSPRYEKALDDELVERLAFRRSYRGPTLRVVHTYPTHPRERA